MPLRVPKHKNTYIKAHRGLRRVVQGNGADDVGDRADCVLVQRVAHVCVAARRVRSEQGDYAEVGLALGTDGLEAPAPAALCP